MRASLQPIQFVLLSLAGWISQHQQDVIEYLVEENRVLKEQHKGRRLWLTDDQRRRLAANGKRIGRRLLMQVASRQPYFYRYLCGYVGRHPRGLDIAQSFLAQERSMIADGLLPAIGLRFVARLSRTR